MTPNRRTGAAAVKMEGGAVMAETVKFLTERGIPVMGHVGLTPQAVNALGGYGARGRSQEEAARILDDGRAIAAAGAFSLVVEGVVEPIAIELTRTIEEVNPAESWITHGREEALLRWCELNQRRARALALVGYEDEDD